MDCCQDFHQENQSNSKNLISFCYGIPKAELHIHVEGSFEPELIFEIAQRNKIQIPYNNTEELREKYKFKNLQEFLDIYYEACSVLLTEKDFEDLIYAYIKKTNSQGGKYSEIFFDPQSHLPRGVSFETLINGLTRGIQRGREDFGFEANLIMCFLRHLSEEDAIRTFEIATPYLDKILGIGLDSSEIGNPPEKFKNIFAICKEKGLRLCAHGGEEGNVETYVKPAIDILNIQRLDHGIRVKDDQNLINELVVKKIPLTLCPLSNLKLQVYKDLSEYPIKKFLEDGLLAMINSDDPAYFGGYIGDNYVAILQSCNLSKQDIIKLAKISFLSTFLNDKEKQKYIDLIDNYVNSFSE